MDSQSIALVRDSFALVHPVSAQAARAFYTRLFARYPAVRGLFGGDLEVQGERLMAMIASGVQLLDRPQELDPVLRALGARHLRYGVREAHYDAVGAALLDTLADALGPQFNDAVRSAWAEFYARVAGAMRAGAASAVMQAEPACPPG